MRPELHYAVRVMIRTDGVTARTPVALDQHHADVQFGGVVVGHLQQVETRDGVVVLDIRLHSAALVDLQSGKALGLRFEPGAVILGDER